MHPEHQAYQNSLREIFKRIEPKKNIVEFGTGEEALSSTVFLEDKAVEKVISVDIEDYSNLINDPRWVFVKQNTSKIELPSGMFQKGAFDLVYVDASHELVQTLYELRMANFLIHNDGLILMDDLLLRTIDSRRTVLGGAVAPVQVFEAVMVFLRGMIATGNDLWFSIDPRNHGWGFLKKKPIFNLQMGWDSDYRQGVEEFYIKER